VFDSVEVACVDFLIEIDIDVVVSFVMVLVSICSLLVKASEKEQ